MNYFLFFILVTASCYAIEKTFIKNQVLLAEKTSSSAQNKECEKWQTLYGPPKPDSRLTKKAQEVPMEEVIKT